MPTLSSGIFFFFFFFWKKGAYQCKKRYFLTLGAILLHLITWLLKSKTLMFFSFFRLPLFHSMNTVHNAHALFTTAINWGCFCSKSKPDNNKVFHYIAASIKNNCKLLLFCYIFGYCWFYIELEDWWGDHVLPCINAAFALSASLTQLSITDCTLLTVWFHQAYLTAEIFVWLISSCKIG